MKFKFPYKNFKPRDLIRRCGYGELQDVNAEEISYVRKLGSGFYPRFHVYINHNETEGCFEFSLHLDQKKPSYSGTTAHSGDYDSSVVENEARRITAVIHEIYQG